MEYKKTIKEEIHDFYLNGGTYDEPEINFDDITNQSRLKNEDRVDQFVTYLQNFISEIELTQGQITQEEIKNILLQELKNGGESLEMIAQIFDKNKTNLSEQESDI